MKQYLLIIVFAIAMCLMWTTMYSISWGVPFKNCIPIGVILTVLIMFGYWGINKSESES